MPNQRPHESARACGCDPAVDYVCERHRKALNDSETEIEGAFAAHDGPRRLSEMVIVVTGPDSDGDLGIMAAGGEWSYLPRFVAEDLIRELQRRLDLKG